MGNLDERGGTLKAAATFMEHPRVPHSEEFFTNQLRLSSVASLQCLLLPGPGQPRSGRVGK